MKIYSMLLKIRFLFKKKGYRWTGNYLNFNEALKKSSGYEDPKLIENIIGSGIAFVQRNEISVNYLVQIVASIFICLNHINKNIINILDLGGATGEHYKLIKKFISKFTKLNYTVCETDELVQKAKNIFCNDELSFTDDIHKVIEVDIILCCGTLQYLADPTDTYSDFVNLNSSFIIIDRFPAIPTDEDRLTIQHVSTTHYKSSYPCWFFSESKWEHTFTEVYNIMLKWNSKNQYVILDGEKVYYSGYVLKKK
jgi:putative methyltransferase (TIGR04325 family)